MNTYERVFGEALRDNIDALNENDFDTIYDRLSEEGLPMCEVTRLFLLANVDPTPYLTEIPSKYARRLPLVTEVEFNNNYDKNLKIGYQAFDGCPNLTSVKLTKRMVLSQFVFHDCKKLQTVIYPDTLEYFNMFVTAYDFSFDNDTVITFDDCDMDWKTLIKLRSQRT